MFENAVPLCYDKTSLEKKQKEGKMMITHKEEREIQKAEHASGGLRTASGMESKEQVPEASGKESKVN